MIVKRRHQVNHDLLLPGLPRRKRSLVVWSSSAVVALGLSSALAWPIVAQPGDNRQGNAPIAVDAINVPESFKGPVTVSEDAPVAAFHGTGWDLAIDGRVTEYAGEMATDESDEASAASSAGDEEGNALLAGAVGQIGDLPGGLQLMHPVTTRRISSPYGWRQNPTGPGNQIHIGQDYPIACGSPVYASEAGTVIVSNWAGHSGMRVTIDHGHNVQTGYSHNSKLLVKIGEKVKQGQLIALAGTTGNSTGCHVHFEVLINGRWHDPRNYLPRIPGQPDAMIDSSHLTVRSKNAPRGNNNQQTAPKDQNISKDPDVVVPKDDTPVVPKPKPKPKPKPSPSDKPSTSPSESESKTPSTSPTDKPSPKPTKPTDPSDSPSPTGSDSKTPSPSDDTSTPTEPSGSPTEKNSGSPTKPVETEDSPSNSSIQTPTAPAATPSLKPSKLLTPETPAPTTSAAPKTTTEVSQTPVPQRTVSVKPSLSETFVPETVVEPEASTTSTVTKSVSDSTATE